MGQIYMQNDSCEWVPIVQADFDEITTECQPDATGIEFASFGQRNISFTCEMTGHHARRINRYFIDGWRTKHGPIRRRTRSKARYKYALERFNHAVNICIEELGMSKQEAKQAIRYLILRRHIQYEQSSNE